MPPPTVTPAREETNPRISGSINGACQVSVGYSTSARLWYSSFSLFWMSGGTGAYSENRVLKLALPWVIDRSEVT